MNSGICLSRQWLRVVLGMMFVTLYAVPLSAQTNGVFDATSGHIVVPYAPALDVSAQFTIEAWLRPNLQSYTFGAVVDKDYGTAFSLGVENVSPPADSVILHLYLGGKTHGYGPVIPAGQAIWTHIAVTVDTVARQAFYYINGVLTKTFTGKPLGYAVLPENITIGSSKYGDEFGGVIDEVRIWNVVRSPDEIADLYLHEAKGNEPGLVAVYHFEDSRDTVAWNRAIGGGLHGSFSEGAHIEGLGWGIQTTEPWTYAFADEHESNDSFAGATPLNYGSMFMLAAVAPGDTDTYKIYMKAGDILRIRTDASVPGDQVVMGMSVVGPDSTTKFLSVDRIFPALSTAASVEGYRYIRVYVGSTGAGGQYTISNTRRDRLQPDEFEPNDTFAEATVLPWGEVVTPSMFPGIDVGIAVPDTDYFRIEGVAGEIGLFPYSVQGTTSGNVYLTMLGPAGKVINTFPSNIPNFQFPDNATHYARIHTTYGAVLYRFAMFKGLIDINGMLYDPCGYGGVISLYDGWQHAYDQGYSLYVDGEWYGAAADYSIVEAGGRQFVFLSKQISGLDVSRKFYVPSAAQGDTLGYMRIQDILENTTGAPVTVTVGVQSDIGSQTTVRILETSNGDAELTTADSWALTNNDPADGRPALTHVFDGIGGLERVDSISIVEDFLYWEWREVTVQPGERKILMYFVAQDSSEENAFRKGPAFSGSALPAAATIGLGADGYNVVNWPTNLVVSAGEPPAVPKEYSLAQNYPNPFNPETKIRFTIVNPQFTVLKVYDILGREVRTLVNEKREPGDYEVEFDARGLASGIYLYRLTAGTFVDTKKMALMR